MAKILLVEDAVDLAQLIARELTAVGYEIVVVNNGLAALEQLTQQSHDLVILDWGLPGIDGLEVLRRLRQLSILPVLMLTGRQDEIDRVVGLEVGADDYLIKPFSMRELIARTHAMLRRVALLQTATPDPKPRSETRSAIRYSGVILDPVMHTATLNGAELHLTRTEFDLLYLFLQHPGQAFARAELLDRIWGMSYSEADRVVDYAIHRLRRKLHPISEAIETVHGVGYRLRKV
jgi:DNA-binding response OmpR family regulator